MKKFDLHPTLIKDTFTVADLNLCKLLLMNDSNYPWFILVPRIDNVSELFELNKIDRQFLNEEIDEISKRLLLYFSAKKMNVATIGNIVSQLHVHVIARKVSDPAWPNPIWNNVDIVPYKDEEKIKLIKNIKKITQDLIIND